MEITKIHEKWQKKWADAKIFEAVPDDKPKFFCNFPYPYINAFQHIGHLFTLMRVEAFARYKRHQGFNVLFPQGWHATGSPIVQAAKRVKNREPKQMGIMASMGITDVTPFEDPTHWISFFAPEFKKDYQSIGMSVDWRREFHTTDLNPHYDKFIRWQFKQLQDKGFVIKGTMPVVWDPKEKMPVGDHDRQVGEGETPQEMILVKHKLEDGRFVVSATLRPDTILGITNLYMHPEFDYKEVSIDGETWIIGENAVELLTQQDRTLEVTGTVKGIDLIGQKTEEYPGHSVLILPATFLDPKVGTGLVHSVPSDSADDLIALWDLQKDEGTLKKYKLDIEEVRAIQPIAILDTPEFGAIAAETILKRDNVKNQNDRKKLDAIRKELYKASHYTATFNESYERFGVVGKKVEEGKETIKRALLESGWADTFYQLTGRVVSRSLTECIVKVVHDQWFIDYGNPEWKKLAHTCLDNMKLYPEKARQQFDNVIDWLHEWACTREAGLGTRLPWDDKWLIESLSDSTIYMAYYTISHLVQSLPIEQVNNNLFDYVLHGKDCDVQCDTAIADAMRKEFDYYYPVDFRNSGKDLIQNHLAFFIFNHTALFPQDKWPKGIGANGWVTVDGQKMSKSLGNMIPVRTVVPQYGPDACRMTILSGGEGMDDPNWETKLAESLPNKFEQMISFCKENYNKGREDEKAIDAWFESVLNRLIQESTTAMEETLFRTAIKVVFFDMQRLLKQYMNRCETPNKRLITQFIEAQLIMLAPFAPHICEEAWEQIGKEGFISLAAWPQFDTTKINIAAEACEELTQNVRSDIRKVKELAKLDTLTTVTLFVPAEWKYELVALIKEKLKETRNPGDIIKAVMATDLKKQGQAIMKTIPRLVNDPSKIPTAVLSQEKERTALHDSKNALEKEFGCTIEIIEEESTHEAKAKNAMPAKPAIIVA